ncbi:MAG: hypothetical protein QM473_13605, partial [Acidobacteriota bacterium]|nr:hypothetical protein [Acidobacteriota bacterium]
SRPVQMPGQLNGLTFRAPIVKAARQKQNPKPPTVRVPQNRRFRVLNSQLLTSRFSVPDCQCSAILNAQR